MAGTPRPETVSTKYQRIATLAKQRVASPLGAGRKSTGPQRSDDSRSRMREFRTSGSVGDPGGQPPGSTRRAPGKAWARRCAM